MNKVTPSSQDVVEKKDFLHSWSTKVVENGKFLNKQKEVVEKN